MLALKIIPRELAIEQFGLNNISPNEEYSSLEDLFVLLYFYHKYQTEAAIKLIGGVEYGYGRNGNTEPATKVVSEEEQRIALTEILKSIDGHFLLVPKDKLELFPSRGAGSRTRESFKSQTGSSFDPMSAASTATLSTLTVLLNPERAARLIKQKSLDQDQLGLSELIDRLIEGTLMHDHEIAYHAEVQESINRVVISELMRLAQNSETYPQVRDIVDQKLLDYQKSMQKKRKRSTYENGRMRMIEMYFKNPKSPPAIESPKIPDGSPIGSACSHG